MRAGDGPWASNYDGPVIRRLVCCVLLVAAVLTGRPSAPAAADPSGVTGEVAITIEAMSPTVLDLTNPSQVVTIKGSARNNSGATLHSVNLHFWRSQTPLESHSELTDALDSKPDDPLGRRLPEQGGDPSNYQSFATLAPGASTPFTVSATIRDLGLGTDEAVYLLGVHARGTDSPDGKRDTLGRGRILAPASRNTLPVATAVKLTTTPTLIGATDFVSDDLDKAVAGDLEAMVAFAERSERTVLLDPALLVELRALSTEHTTAGVPRAGSSAAVALRERISTLIEKGRVLRLPYGDPDLARLYAAGNLNDFETGLSWTSTALATANLPEVAQLPLVADLGRYANEDLTLLLARAGCVRIFGDNYQASGSEATTDGRHTTVHAVDRLDAPGLGPGDASTAVQLLQRRLAEEVLKNGTRVHIVRTAADLPRAELVPGVERAVPLPNREVPVRYDITPQQAPKWSGLANRAKSLFSDSQLLEELTGTDRSAVNATAASQAYSTQFTSEDQALAFLGALPDEQATAREVRLSSASQIVLGSDRNVFPMTVTNPLKVPVRLRVEFDSNSPNRVDIPTSEIVTVGPGEQHTVSVTPIAKANGVVTIQAQLATVEGTRFGPVVPVEVSATGFGRVGWIIIIVSGAVVLGGTFLRIRAVQRERSREGRE